ncbi:restriction endonuclease subunit S [Alloscardovia sp. HMSC034E08]|uniref:restriction endonuclease subunit S n=1 Tax=Alloscardovia sp. HMSC034E08 TaxID=1739413 RepID=UPI0014391E99|nr:restriction endonuclease subunit S [Alloscardovia sp. HMSC034E08]
MVKLGDIAQIYNGNSINATVKKQKYAGLQYGLPYIATKDVAFDGTVTYDNGVKIPAGEPKFKTAPAGTVFVCSEGGSAGKKTALINQEVCFGNKLYALVSDTSRCTPEYLYLFTRSPQFREQFKKRHGGLIGGVSLTEFSTIEIPLPSLDIQIEITARLRGMLKTCTSLAGQTNTTARRIGEYRQLLIDRAFVPRNPEALIPLGNLLEDKPRNGKSVRPNSDKIGVRSLSLSATTSGTFRPEFFKYVDLKVPEDSYLWLEPEDILIQRANTIDYVGTAALYTGKSCEFIYPDLMMKLRPKSDVLPRFMLLQLQSSRVRQYFRNNAIGTAGNMPKINQKVVMSTPFLYYPMESQKALVADLAPSLEELDDIQRKLEVLSEQIRQMVFSLLQQAFATI